jgi:hypothetical protein
MYVLQLDSTERAYLMSVLKRRRAPTATGLVAQLKSSDDVFGFVMWSDGDIASELNHQGLEETPQNIRAVRESYHARHIEDQMVEHGWGVLEEAISELKRRQGTEPAAPGSPPSFAR